MIDARNVPPSKYTRNTSAEEIASAVDLTGRLAVITGGSVGLGYETARVLARAGAEVFIAARRSDVLEAAAAALEAEGARVRYHVVDHMSVESVDVLADAILALDRPVDMLIANAGIMACPLSRTEVGVESQFMTNVVAHAVLLSRLAKTLVRSDDGRFVSLSSTGHHLSPVNFNDLQFELRPYDKWQAYGQSKTGCALLAVKAAGELGARGVSAFAVHPGMIQTELGRHLGEDHRKSTEERLGKNAAEAFYALFKDVQRGAATSVWAATEPDLKGRGPLYLEDANIAERIDAPNRTYGVLDYALDAKAADRLWSEIEVMVGRQLPL
ncbi:SDR family NAD(P)-dependent oxidoreductase [Novosphingobium sp. HII-3]|uniref:SDR family NAD(P)-dependent oxidoreductase n=1 Tax=Novosphingobium sp. HII-3 TaxID=2075565 RepID=UPI000CDB4B92|nr:SDR family NAD(P)-dependent oxidoreductase [Novosphingobium sp. HII-3]